MTVSNFGLIVPGTTAGKVDYVCDDVFDRSDPTRIRRSPSGTIFIPNDEGLITSSDGCSFTTGSADLRGNHILNVAIDAKSPNVVYALGGVPRTLWRSEDGGKTFAVRHRFAADLLLDGLVLPPGRTTQIYVFGAVRTDTSPVWISEDDGVTFTLRDPAKSLETRLASGLEFLAADPVRPEVLYFTVIRTEGDELWRTSDGGKTVSRLLQMGDSDALSGLAFGAGPNDLYVAGKAILFEAGKPPGKLYVSRDGGQTWAAPIPSGAAGPHYNCLAYDQGRLYACSLNRGSRDDALLSVSTDEGRTWQPVSRLVDVAGPKACVAEACQAVAGWLCNKFTHCTEGVIPNGDAGAPDAPFDAGRRDTGFAVDETDDGGCGCRVGGKSGDRGLAWLALFLGFVAYRRFRR